MYSLHDGRHLDTVTFTRVGLVIPGVRGICAGPADTTVMIPHRKTILEFAMSPASAAPIWQFSHRRIKHPVNVACSSDGTVVIRGNVGSRSLFCMVDHDTRQVKGWLFASQHAAFRVNGNVLMLFRVSGRDGVQLYGMNAQLLQNVPRPCHLSPPKINLGLAWDTAFHVYVANRFMNVPGLTVDTVKKAMCFAHPADVLFNGLPVASTDRSIVILVDISYHRVDVWRCSSLQLCWLAVVASYRAG